jgi:uncharacterized protein (UPF0332 family)
MAAQPFDWLGYYTLANELGARENDEASLRSAMSRAYYYVYHLALERAHANGFTTTAGEAMHKQLWRNYSDSPEPNCRKLAEIAKRMKDKRERADYNATYPRLNDEIAGMLTDAQTFAERLRVLQARFPDPAHCRQ